MKVHFIFPDGDTIAILDLPQVPSRGHKISFENLPKEMFETESDFEKYREAEHELRQWLVGDVIWSINYDGVLRVDVELKEIGG